MNVSIVLVLFFECKMINEEKTKNCRATGTSAKQTLRGVIFVQEMS